MSVLPFLGGTLGVSDRKSLSVQNTLAPGHGHDRPAAIRQAPGPVSFLQPASPDLESGVGVGPRALLVETAVIVVVDPGPGEMVHPGVCACGLAGMSMRKM